MGTYKDLKVWQVNQSCIKLSLQVMDDLPPKYGFQHIGKQLFRAVTSVGANIAEGQDNYKGKEFIRYLNIAIRSAIEADHWIETLRNIDYSTDILNKLSEMNIEAIKMLKGLKQSIELKTKN